MMRNSWPWNSSTDPTLTSPRPTLCSSTRIFSTWPHTHLMTSRCYRPIPAKTHTCVCIRAVCWLNLSYIITTERLTIELVYSNLGIVSSQHCWLYDKLIMIKASACMETDEQMLCLRGFCTHTPANLTVPSVWRDTGIFFCNLPFKMLFKEKQKTPVHFCTPQKNRDYHMSTWKWFWEKYYFHGLSIIEQYIAHVHHRSNRTSDASGKHPAITVTE